MSSRQRRPSPIISIELRITLVDRQENLRKLAEKDKKFVVKRGLAEILLRSGDPRDVMEKTRRVVEEIRNVSSPPKDFKESQGKSNAS